MQTNDSKTGKTHAGGLVRKWVPRGKLKTGESIFILFFPDIDASFRADKGMRGMGGGVEYPGAIHRRAMCTRGGGRTYL